MDERSTLTNMGAEMGAFSAILVPDAQTQTYLYEQRATRIPLADWMCSDEACAWVHDIELDASAVEPMVAAPGDPGQGMPLSQAGRITINLAYGGSCTGGKWEDWVRYHRVLAWGLARGLRVADHVKLYLQYGSADVQRRVREAGWEADFSAVGAQSVAPGCGACINMGPGASSDAADVTVSAQNRNFSGRSGPGSVWLASPETVAASALMGHLASFEQLQESVAV
jgi:3-isopropylmalate/(R)-2-methylmalate dehydratase large subunit